MKNKNDFFTRAFIFISALTIINSCKSNTETVPVQPALELIASHALQINQPSGIAFNKDYTACWIIDGGDERVYKTDLEGNILERLSFKGEDPEGIYFDGSSSLWIVEEELREIVKIDLSGEELARYKTNMIGTENNGLEGITFDNNGNIFVLNEKNPNALFSLNKNYLPVNKYDMNFAVDVSDVCFNKTSRNFFVLSDESKALFVWNIDEGLKASFKLNETKNEGIAIDPGKSKIIIVNDSLNTMYEYKLKM